MTKEYDLIVPSSQLTTIMEILMIYLIGYILAYILGRYIGRKLEGDKYSWTDVCFLVIVSLFSYLAVITFLCTLILLNRNKNNNIKPPTWL